MKPFSRKALIMLSAILLFFISIPLLFFMEKRFSFSLLSDYLEVHDITEDISFSSRNSSGIRLSPTEDESFFLACIPTEFSSAGIMELAFSHFETLEIDGVPFGNNEEIFDFAHERDREIVTMRILGPGNELLFDGYIQFMFADHLPTMYLTVSENAMDIVNATDRNAAVKPEAEANIKLINPDGSVDIVCKGELSRHGNTSFDDFGEKPYNLNLSARMSLFGMDPGKKWVLKSNGQYATVLLKNEAAYQAAREMGHISVTDSRFFNLYVNGRYTGLYQLSHNVQAPEMLKDEAYALYEYDTKYKLREHYFKYKGDHVAIHYPKGLSDEEAERLEAFFIEALEETERDGDYERYIDLPSFIQMYMLQDFFVQTDIDRDSLYFYLSEDGKIHAGPLWDFDCTCAHISTGPYHEELEVRSRYFNDFGELFFSGLEASPRFRKAAEEYYRESFSPIMHGLLDNNFHNSFSDTETSMFMSNFLNSVSYTGSGTDRNAGDLRKWLENRLSFLDRYYADENSYCLVRFHFSWGNMTIAGERGKALDYLPVDNGESDSDGIWGCVRGFKDVHGEAVETGLIVDSDMDLYAEYNGE